MTRQHLIALGAATILAVTSQAAHAHTGGGGHGGFAYGFMHPIGGLDHVLAMLMVGVLAAQIGGRAMWLLPLSFVGVMVLGGLLGAMGAALPLVELGIALSVLVLGAMVAFGFKLAVTVAMGLVGFFAVFHGFAHGAEMPASASGLTYGVGFVLGTGLLNALGLATGLAFLRLVPGRGAYTVNAVGSVAALAGLLMVTGTI